MTDIARIVVEIDGLPHFQSFHCAKCSTPIREYTLQIYAICPRSGIEHKCRNFGAIEAEIQDGMDAVLLWTGTGECFDAAMRRHPELFAGENES